MVKAIAAVLFGLLVACGSAEAAKAPPRKAAPAEEPPMRVHLVRSAQAGCEPACPEWIAAQGKINAASLTQFKKILSQLGTRKVPVLIHSGGGDMDASLEIGRLIRARGLDIGVAKTAFVTCAPKDAGCRKSKAGGVLQGIPDDSFAICASACAFVLAAGERRFVGPWAFIGVHQVLLLQTYNKVMQTFKVTMTRDASGAQRLKKELIATKVISQKVVPKKAPKAVYTRVEHYFSQMGIGKQIMPLLLQTPNASVHWLTQDELRTTGMATHRLNGEQLLGGAIAAGDGWAAGRGAEKSGAGGLGALPSASEANCSQFGGLALGCTPDPSPRNGGDGVTVPFPMRAAPAR